VPGLGQTGHLCPPYPECITVKKRPSDPDRDQRIHEQIIVDAYGPEEQARGWYCYLEKMLGFPFQARCIASNVVSPLRKGEVVEAYRMAPEDACSGEMMVLIRWQERTMAVPLSQLAAINASEASAKAIGDWHYWLDQGCRF
jgi:hypothetical protein